MQFYVTPGWRIKAEIAKLVEAYAEEMGISKNAAVQELIKKGYEATMEKDRQ